mmetsp:Transcript_127180/g.220057  ORF Transcript_127180/g.220057 Transcript_127180/m.220057 type:complete len:84 (-) Transcript_127180:987-1238(-)
MEPLNVWVVLVLNGVCFVRSITYVLKMLEADVDFDAPSTDAHMRAHTPRVPTHLQLPYLCAPSLSTFNMASGWGVSHTMHTST